uniref:Uncharacterized protein n=1 Tax=Esox lucius TaxID=8010 RepID=A0A3P8YJ15_ESOLU
NNGLFEKIAMLRDINMTEVPVLDFASSERSGRRNALPDILGSPVGDPADLSLKLAELNLTETEQQQLNPEKRM